MFWHSDCIIHYLKRIEITVRFFEKILVAKVRVTSLREHEGGTATAVSARYVP